MIQKAKANTMEDFRYVFVKAFMDKVVERIDANERFLRASWTTKRCAMR